MEGAGSLFFLFLYVKIDCFALFFMYTNLFVMQRNYPNLSASVAGDRKFDVYMGIDVFGRNTYGGGQWNVCVTFNPVRYMSLCFCIL